MPKRKAAMSLRALSVNEVRAIGKSVAKGSGHVMLMLKLSLLPSRQSKAIKVARAIVRLCKQSKAQKGVRPKG